MSTAAIQLAHAAGLEVFVTSRSEDKRARVLQLGADAAFETGARLPRKADAVIESVGAAHGVIPSNPYVREELSPFAARLLATSRVQSLRESSSRIFECRAIPWAPVRISHVC